MQPVGLNIRIKYDLLAFAFAELQPVLNKHCLWYASNTALNSIHQKFKLPFTFNYSIFLFVCLFDLTAIRFEFGV